VGVVVEIDVDGAGVLRLGLRQVVEGVVDFDGLEVLRVVFEPFALGQFGGIEPLLPVVVIPARRADPNIAIRLAQGCYSNTLNLFQKLL
jgi:hypothetical protein